MAILRNAIQCLQCQDVIASYNRHDFKTCKCGCVSVDGGTEYLRRVGAREHYKERSCWDTDARTLPDLQGMYIVFSPQGLLNPSVIFACREDAESSARLMTTICEKGEMKGNVFLTAELSIPPTLVKTPQQGHMTNEVKREKRDGLTHEEIVVACRNIGYDMTCGACAALFYTGGGGYDHDPGCTNADQRDCPKCPAARDKGAQCDGCGRPCLRPHHLLLKGEACPDCKWKKG